MSMNNPNATEEIRRRNLALERRGILSYQKESKMQRIAEFVRNGHNGHNNRVVSASQMERPYGEDMLSSRPFTRKELLSDIVVPNEPSRIRKFGHVVKSAITYEPKKTIATIGPNGEIRTAKIPRRAQVISPYEQQEIQDIQMPQMPQQQYHLQQQERQQSRVQGFHMPSPQEMFYGSRHQQRTQMRQRNRNVVHNTIVVQNRVENKPTFSFGLPSSSRSYRPAFLNENPLLGSKTHILVKKKRKKEEHPKTQLLWGLRF